MQTKIAAKLGAKSLAEPCLLLSVGGYLFRSMDPFRVRLEALRANGSPAFAVYQMDKDGVFRAAAIHILTVENGQIAEINDYLTFDGQLFSRFHLDLVV